MKLSDLVLKIAYRSDSDNLITDFYDKCLRTASLYKRAVGYFTSNSLALAAKGLQQFINNGGRMQLIASPLLLPEDIDAINRGYIERESVIEQAILRQLDITEDEIINERLNVLANLVANNQLDIKIVVFKPEEEPGIYHEKIGIFLDMDGNVVAFTGSANETVGGLYSNFESIDVFCSWREGDIQRVWLKVDAFDKLWDNSTDRVDVLDFPVAAKRRLLDYKKPVILETDPELSRTVVKEGEPPKEQCRIPSWLNLRYYQREAIASWLENDGLGILEMATGTGKTLTALAALATLYQGLRGIGMVIVCPYKHLVDQWAKDAHAFGMQPVIGYESRAKWETHLNERITALNMGIVDSFSLITTNATFITDTMQASLARIKRPAAIVFDEAHHVGAPIFRSKLPQNFEFRLALSATPERWYDEEGDRALNSYFKNGIVYSFGLKDAIGSFLTPYYYYPCLIELTEDEAHEYIELTRKIARVYGTSSREHSTAENTALRGLLLKRARLLSSARNKLPALREQLKGKEKSKYNLFYCGDSRVDGERQIELITRMLGRELGMKVHTFTAAEDLHERRRLLRDFENGELQGLVAIRCLDEGVDVPATQTAYILASSTNPREFIQRRGRVLRLYPGKRYATIYDFIVLPPRESYNLISDDVFNIERRLVARELRRVKEFTELAINGPQASLMLLEVQSYYHLLDI